MHKLTEPGTEIRGVTGPARACVLALAVAVVPAVVVTLAAATAATASPIAGGTTYYVDTQGSNAASGTSPTSPWGSLADVPTTLKPGDRVLLRSGRTYREPLTVSSSGTAGARIKIGSYGAGPRPTLTGSGCLTVSGSYVLVQGIKTTWCTWGGITVAGDHDTLSNNVTSHNVAGVFVKTGADYTDVTGNTVANNQQMSVNTPGGDDDSGAFGVLVNGDHTTVEYNRISGQFANSYDYGVDGSAVEIFGAQYTSIHHNIARHNHAFTELGDPRSAHTTYAYNAVTSNLSDAEFLVTRGAQSNWGPVLDTTVVHNSVRLSGAGSQGFICYAGCSSGVLSLHANVITAVAKVGYADSGFDSGDNIFWGGQVQFQKGLTDRVVAPGFVSDHSSDFTLSSTSPAIDRGSSTSWTTDVMGESSKVDGNGDGVSTADVGAFEWH
jgi:hypothetical protein